jgi:NAD(P)-dependent dehydrogenase (short-subunit alcohol dehydrogenase family)
MTGIEQFRYDGKRALIVGGATGMGAAAAKIVGALGAEVINLDYAGSRSTFGTRRRSTARSSSLADPSTPSSLPPASPTVRT